MSHTSRAYEELNDWPTEPDACVCVCVCVCAQLFSCVWFFVTPWTVAHQAPLSMEFSRQEYWSGLPLPAPGDLPNPGIEPVSPSLAGRLFTTKPPGKPILNLMNKKIPDHKQWNRAKLGPGIANEQDHLLSVVSAGGQENGVIYCYFCLQSIRWFHCVDLILCV